MYFIENLVFLVVAAIIFIYVIRHTNEWATKAQQRDVEHSKKSTFAFVPPERWGSRFIYNIRRFGIIFSTFILLLIAYGLMFGSGS